MSRRQRPDSVVRSSRPIGGLAIALALSFALVLAGCGGSSSSAGTGGGGSNGSVTVDLPGTGGSANLAPAEGWPAAPSDVPPFPGKLESLMPQRAQGQAGIRARMFFNGVSADQFTAYLGLLRSKGYTLKGVVYYSERQSKSDADARAQRGDVDAVIATKTPRLLTITRPTSPSDTVTFDLDGLTMAESEAMAVMPWPDAWLDKVPGPDWCTLTTMGTMGTTAERLQISCQVPGSDEAARATRLQDYLDLLKRDGFTVTETHPGSDAYKATDGKTDVYVELSSSGFVSIKAGAKGWNAWDNSNNPIPTPPAMDTPPAETPPPAGDSTLPPATAEWPADWAAIPAPAGCAISNVSTAGGRAEPAVCVYPDSDAKHHEQIAQAYQAKLLAAGFDMLAASTDPTTGTISMFAVTKDGLQVMVTVNGPANAMLIAVTG